MGITFQNRRGSRRGQRGPSCFVRDIGRRHPFWHAMSRCTYHGKVAAAGQGNIRGRRRIGVSTSEPTKPGNLYAQWRPAAGGASSSRKYMNSIFPMIFIHDIDYVCFWAPHLHLHLPSAELTERALSTSRCWSGSPVEYSWCPFLGETRP